jgi:hypothetical protein
MKMLITLMFFFNASVAFSFIAVPMATTFESQSIPSGSSSRPKCDGNLPPGDLKVTFRPSCYSVNIRSATGLINPHGAKVDMNITLNRGAGASGPKATSLRYSLPVKITWPEFYGYRCSYVGSKVTCKINGTNVNYEGCKIGKLNSYGKADNYFYDCERKGDPLLEAEYNQKISCSWIYVADYPDFIPNPNFVSCKIESKYVDLGTGVVSNIFDTVKKSWVGISPQVYARQGMMEVYYKNLTYPKPFFSVDSRTKEILKKGEKTSLAISFKQGATTLNTKGLNASFVKGSKHQCIAVDVLFPGVKGYCGSLRSPLMLFFGDQRPRFFGQSTFQLKNTPTLISWPEKGAPGYFLAHDKYKDKNIVNGTQLFGDANSFNGFEVLKRLDSNNDSKIDKKDKMFKELVLWQDSNGNGRSESGEVISLKDKGVVSIDLDYINDQRKFIKVGTRAELRQESFFEFKEKGIIKKGAVIDVWFSELGK